MLLKRKNPAVVGLNIEAGSVAAVEVKTNGVGELSGSGFAALAPGVVREGEVSDVEALADVLRELFSDFGLGKNVRLGIANQKVVVRTLGLPLIENPEELETAVRFQAQDQISMPLEEVVMDFEVVGRGESEEGAGRMEVVVVAARRDMLSALMSAMHSAGLRPMGIDLSAFGMVRALANDTVPAEPADSDDHRATDGVAVEQPAAPAEVGVAVEQPAAPAEVGAAAGDFVPSKLYCSLGDVTNVAVARGGICLFTRISAFGIEGVAQRLTERRRLTLEEAHELLLRVGLERSVDDIEGDRETITTAREVLAQGTSELAGELRLSMEGYGAQEGASSIEGIVACGPGVMIPGLTERLQQELGHGVRIGRPSALSHLDGADSARLTLPYGLAIEA